MFAREGARQRFPTHGPLSWSVPGCVSGWDELRTTVRHASRSRELLAPAIDYAEEGFPVSRDHRRRLAAAPSEAWRSWPDSAKTYPDRRPTRRATARSSAIPNLAAQLPRDRRAGPRRVLQGRDRRADRRFSERNGGYFSLEDFADHTSDWIEPVSTNYRGYDVWELPPNGQGIAVLQMLNLLEPYDLQVDGPRQRRVSAPVRRSQEAGLRRPGQVLRRPGVRRAARSTELISKEYAARARQADRPASKPPTNVPAGDPKLRASGDTIYLTVVDKDRNCCSLIQSNYFGFGSQVVPGDVGFVLQNRGCLFALDDKHLNRLEPHKRPFHTIIPAMVTKDGKPWFCFGVMGGDMQPQGHVQVLVNMIDFGMNVQAAGDAARVRHAGSATPTGQPADGDGGTVSVEPGISDAVVDELERRGHTVERQAAAPAATRAS